MVGLGRLDDLQACVESLVADGVEGDVIEAGAWRGGASILMRATLDTLGRRPHRLGRRLVPGLPGHRAGRRGAVLSARSTFSPRRSTRCARASRASAASAACASCRASSRTRCRRSRRALGDRPARRRHLRADAARARALYPGLAAGGHLIVDDYGSFEGCRRAVDQFRTAHGDHRAAGDGRLHVRALAPDARRGSRSCRRYHRQRRRAPALECPARPAGAHCTRGRAAIRELATLRERVAAAEAADRTAGVAARRLGRSAAMIVFASSITDPEVYERAPSPGSASPPSPTPRCWHTPPPARCSAPTT